MDTVLQAIQRSNQRGGRMLSVIDLIEAGTITRDEAAWLIGRIERGSSWLVGAVPGGAGKTTIMSALLVHLPQKEYVYVTAPNTRWERSSDACVVSFEISAGRYDGYIWDQQVRRLCELGRQGCRIVSNLHADTLEEARHIVCDECGAPEAGFNAFEMFLPVTPGAGAGGAPMVEQVEYFEDGIWKIMAGLPPLQERERAIAGFLDDCRADGLCTCGEIREAWLTWQGA